MSDNPSKDIELFEKDEEREESIALLDEGKEEKRIELKEGVKCCPLCCSILLSGSYPCCCCSIYTCCVYCCCIIFFTILSVFLWILIASLTFKSPDIHFDFPSTIINTPKELEHLAFNEDEAVQIFSKTITFRTVNHEDNVIEFDKLFDHLNTSFPLFFSKLRFIQFPVGWMFIWDGKISESILLVAHWDVVGVEQQTWEYDPWSGKIYDGWVYGRGTMDDKASATSIMNSVEILLQENYTPQKTFFFCFGLDEETGSQGAIDMSNYLSLNNISPQIGLDEGGFVIKNVFTDFGVEKNVALIATNEKGYLDLNVSVSCNGGHSSMPEPSENCIQKMSESMLKIDSNKLYPSHVTDSEIIQTMFECVFSHASFFYRIFFAMFRKSKSIMNAAFSGSPETNALIRTVSSPTVIVGGTANNVSPNFVSVIVNSRVHPEDTIEEVKRYIEKKMDGKGYLNFESVGVEKSFAKDSCIRCREFDLVQQTIDSVFVDVIKSPFLVIGSTDLFYYKDVCKSTYNFSPLLVDAKHDDQSREHGSDERISTKVYVNSIKFYYAFIKNAELLKILNKLKDPKHFDDN